LKGPNALAYLFEASVTKYKKRFIRLAPGHRSTRKAEKREKESLMPKFGRGRGRVRGRGGGYKQNF
jgi:hypothetical protein